MLGCIDRNQRGINMATTETPEQIAERICADLAMSREEDFFDHLSWLIAKAIRDERKATELVHPRRSVDLNAVLQRLSKAVEEFDDEVNEAWLREDRPDLWDHVVEVPIEDARAILLALSSLRQGAEV
jgi:hypothetical protein